MRFLYSLLCCSAVLAMTMCAKSPPETSAQKAPATWQQPYAELLKKYASAQGVRYADWKANTADMQRLSEVTANLGEVAVPVEPQAALAYYLDAYNAWVLQRILSVYPIPGPLEHDADFFKRETITVAGKRMSLDHLENGILRTQFSEPRIHFALNCASKSCPPLRTSPYSGTDLNTVLEAQAQAYLSSTEGCVEEDGDLVISQIFEWFAADFEKSADSVLAFIQRHRKPAPQATQIRYRPYDWNLNSIP